MLKDFISAIRGGICGFIGDRYENSKSNSQSQTQSHTSNRRQIYYFDANILYGYALMQKLPYKDFMFFTTTSLDEVLKTPDDNDYGYWVVCDLYYTNECNDRVS